MTRSLKKGPYIDAKLAKKVSLRKPSQGGIKTWARASQIAPEFVGYTFLVHTGKNFDEVFVTEDMVGHRLWGVGPENEVRQARRSHAEGGRNSCKSCGDRCRAGRERRR